MGGIDRLIQKQTDSLSIVDHIGPQRQNAHGRNIVRGCGRWRVGGGSRHSGRRCNGRRGAVGHLTVARAVAGGEISVALVMGLNIVNARGEHGHGQTGLIGEKINNSQGGRGGCIHKGHGSGGHLGGGILGVGGQNVGRKGHAGSAHNGVGVGVKRNRHGLADHRYIRGGAGRGVTKINVARVIGRHGVSAGGGIGIAQHTVAAAQGRRAQKPQTFIKNAHRARRG